MLCRACGMESRRTDICEWCKKPLTQEKTQTLPQTPQPGPPSGGLPPLPVTGGLPPLPGQQTSPPAQGGYSPYGAPPGANTGRAVRVSLTGEVIEVEAPPPPMPQQPTVMPGGYPGAAPGPMPPQTMPTMQLPRSAPAGVGMPLDHVSPQSMKEMARQMQTPLGERWEKFLAMGLPLMVISMLMVHFSPGSLLVVAMADVFLLSLLMGATGAIPSYDDAVADVGVVLVVCFLLGPLIAFIVYVIVALVKQEGNSAIFGLLGLNFFVTKAIGIAFASSGDTLSLMAVFGMFNLVGFLSVFVGVAGWMLSSFFRPLNE